MDRWTNEGMEKGLIDRQTDGRMDGQKDRSVNRLENILFCLTGR
jgi:hypothetical protein